MKGGREYRVPLSDRAAEILATMAQMRTGELIFPSAKAGRPLSGMAMEMMLRRMKAEAALDHVGGDATERAYRREPWNGAGSLWRLGLISVNPNLLRA